MHLYAIQPINNITWMQTLETHNCWTKLNKAQRAEAWFVFALGTADSWLCCNSLSPNVFVLNFQERSKNFHGSSKYVSAHKWYSHASGGEATLITEQRTLLWNRRACRANWCYVIAIWKDPERLFTNTVSSNSGQLISTLSKLAWKSPFCHHWDNIKSAWEQNDDDPVILN